MNINDVTKQELVNRLSFRCKHRHNGLRHSECYEKKNGATERIGFLDIETNDFKADYGYVLSYSILSDKNKLYCRAINRGEIQSLAFDKELMKQLCKDIENFDRVIVYWGSNKRFDLPFLRTRAEAHGLKFPGYKDLWVTDVYDIVKNKLKLRNNRLATVCEHLGIRAKTHPLRAKEWQRALAGDKKSLDYVLVHNKEDVFATRDVFNRLSRYVRLTRTSI